MRLIGSIYTTLLFALSFVYAGGVAAGGELLPEPEGLWEYADLITSNGESLPLTGVFLIKDGIFLQQSIFNGEPFPEQGSMAHVGSCWTGGSGLRLTANQTLSMSPVDDQRLSSAGITQHDLKVTRKGDELKLVFGGGTSTIQTFKRIGDASDSRVYAFSDGALAFVNGYFILVTGDAQSAVTGYGKYTQAGDALTLNVIRWAQSDGTNTQNLRDVVLQVSFDGGVLKLPNGKSFNVVR